MLIVGVTVGFFSLIIFQQKYTLVNASKKERPLRGAASMTEAKEITTQFFDLSYYFVYRNGEVLIDSYMISLNSLRKSFNMSEASKSDLLEVSTLEGTINVPNVSDKLFLPIADKDIRFYFWSAIGVHLGSWLFFVIQLIWMRRLIKNSMSGDFFTQSNVSVFMNLAYLYMALPFMILLVRGFFNNRLLPDGLSLPEGYQLINETTNFQIPFLFIGFILLLIAQAFRHGLKLQKEQSLTI